MEFSWFLLKKCYSLLIMAMVWDWNGCNLLSNIFFAAWIELVTTMILNTFSLMQAWLMLHLIANNSASVLVTNATWWTILTRGWLAKYMYNINVVILFLILASVTMKAMDREKEIRRTISSSSWMQILSFSFLLTKLKEKQSEKLLVKWKPEVNYQLKGENNGRIL